jgi:hypothetical protein
LIQLARGFDILIIRKGLNSGKQPVQGGYQFPKWGFAVLLVFRRRLGRTTNPIDEVFGHPMSLV